MAVRGRGRDGDGGISEVQAKLLVQLAEKTRDGAVSSLQCKRIVLAAMLILALGEVFVGGRLWGNFCSGLSLGSWLFVDGIVACVGATFGLISLWKAVAVASSVDLQEYLLPEGKERDASGDLTGTFRLASQLSDLLDVALLLSFLLGCYGYYAVAEKCDDTLRLWVGRALVMKFVTPVSAFCLLKFVGILGIGPLVTDDPKIAP
eukprot:TRINITY_DN45629_c0_g1_i1.p1 TRINITY_DN45629_c0_g1~~TRINITY_DN45629_c0_g1_i1.p1  ORF type:complete len:223 (-),score=43.77 TRINITY_DN45629_c0_g1_i1:80-694(-)